MAPPNLAARRRELAEAWSSRAVRRGLLGTVLLFAGSLTPAYLPQNSPWWEPLRALGLDSWPVRVLGTALAVAGLGLLADAWLRLRPRPTLVARPWAVCLLWSLPFLLAPPVFSHDAYAYAAEGWLLRNGLNPYENPISVLPGAFADQAAWAWRYTTAMYPPLSLQLFHGLVILAQNNPYVAATLMRIPALVGVALIVVLLPKLADRVGVDREFTAWFAVLNPILVIDLIGGAHNDALMMGLVVLALWLAFDRRFWLAAITVGVATSIKQPALLAAWAVALIDHPWESFRWRDSLRALGRLALATAIGAGVFAGITWLSGLGYGWVWAATVPGAVITLAPTSLIGGAALAILTLLGQPEAAVSAWNGIRIGGLALTGVAMVWLALTVGRRRPLAFLSWGWLLFAFGGIAMNSWYVTWGGLLLPLTRPSDRVVKLSVVVMATLLTYGAGGLAWRNDAIGLVFGAAALLLALVWRHTQAHAQSTLELQEIHR
ncbi:MAG: polyprenol phosphomannose-dependent alpha 1,6 mannosyltransferase MptB [Propionicimonas sp.]|uniref:polyprenol phosphomannose-dependent alpha 1,6 mannosyltransferase MptB n=1 Tax=Propionicimonas sp. TaxID=1955623 RepID=UPI002B1FA124|nr:polyprenol phosphomannose-dependent alpha 1,6 mannosyltransferase MptB [Propionicimonas sp.]MEA4945197.1 polyprenol phosphomannose-dependent alpha 1,6 mannosyltransferase MptB [Propionicimonas sp.]MEA5052853.1 polyprenol phosphomannose-dependent alpha 1,6 mannosyltransferase MptB [Propionicimonas sp.]